MTNDFHVKCLVQVQVIGQEGGANYLQETREIRLDEGTSGFGEHR